MIKITLAVACLLFGATALRTERKFQKLVQLRQPGEGEERPPRPEGDGGDHEDHEHGDEECFTMEELEAEFGDFEGEGEGDGERRRRPPPPEDEELAQRKGGKGKDDDDDDDDEDEDEDGKDGEMDPVMAFFMHAHNSVSEACGGEEFWVGLVETAFTAYEEGGEDSVEGALHDYVAAECPDIVEIVGYAAAEAITHALVVGTLHHAAEHMKDDGGDVLAQLCDDDEDGDCIHLDDIDLDDEDHPPRPPRELAMKKFLKKI